MSDITWKEIEVEQNRRASHVNMQPFVSVLKSGRITLNAAATQLIDEDCVCCKVSEGIVDGRVVKLRLAFLKSETEGAIKSLVQFGKRKLRGFNSSALVNKYFPSESGKVVRYSVEKVADNTLVIDLKAM